MERQQRSFVMIKPDGVQRGLVGAIIARLEAKGFKLAGMKLVRPPRPLLEEHYVDIKSRSFFPGFIAFMESGPVVAMCWEGAKAVPTIRQMVGATNPLEAAPGTVRGDHGLDAGRNLIHASDSADNAAKELALWFTPDELQDYTLAQQPNVYES